MKNINYLDELIKDLRLAGYSPKTVRVYWLCVKKAFENMPANPLDWTLTDVRDYFNSQYEKGLSARTQISAYCALKFLFEKTLGIPWPMDRIPRLGKFNERRPRPLTRNEVENIIRHAPSLRYKCIFTLIYSAGLRVSEACNLKIGDIHKQDMKIRVVEGKGGQNRMTVLAKRAAEILEVYIDRHRPQNYLFSAGRKHMQEGWLFSTLPPDKPLHTRSVQHVFSTIKERLNLPGYVSVHSLRHSFATHLIEDGMSVFSLQQLLGHRWLKTTMNYVYIADRPRQQYFSPIDNMQKPPDYAECLSRQ